MPSTAWQKSSYSGASDNCVEVRAANGTVELRESDEGHLILRTAPGTFTALLHALKAGEFDHHA
ncbi:DUF397 domain-containing protein [Streptomyces sp. 1331.2]|uniref:DUF397 domain-containing protein n=1 Tax=Streptomyces sp. 1331.2 TaxID=1938835 RepID=UPI000BDDBABA|nr:DUF397 domain-containing protein [Streptomyces sp. 1331.2]SOB83340.1 protein of unknown function [Streptomyces sp. 1331.2]